jgi:tetratricopeptide (TPR) repeat protein
MKKLRIIVALSVAVTVVVVWMTGAGLSKSLPAGVSPDDYDAAAQLFSGHYGHNPDRIDVLSLLAEQAVQDAPETAVACFEEIPDAHPLYGHSARLQQGQVLYRLGRAADAENHLRRFLELERLQPIMTRREFVVATEHLRYLLGIQLRNEEQHELVRSIYQLEEASAHSTIVYCFPSLMIWNGSTSIQQLEKFLEIDPQNMHLRIALGRYRTSHGRLDEAIGVLEQCCDEEPGNLAARAALLQVLRERGDDERFDAMLQQLPVETDQEPWLLIRLRGHDHNDYGRHADAMRCFERMLHIDPTNAESWLGLARACQDAGAGDSDQHRQALHTAHVLARMQNRIGWIQEDPHDIQPLIEIAELCREIEFNQHALAVAQLARRVDPDNDALKTIFLELAEKP